METETIKIKCECGQTTGFVRDETGLHYAARHGKGVQPAKLACVNCHKVLAEPVRPEAEAESRTVEAKAKADAEAKAKGDAEAKAKADAEAKVDVPTGHSPEKTGTKTKKIK